MTISQCPLSLSQPVYTATQVLQNEGLVARQLNILMPDLMEHAGAAAFHQIQHCWPKLSSMLVVCGQGNNGGDGFVIARLAHLAGIKVSVLLLAQQEPQASALIAYQSLELSSVDIIKAKCFSGNDPAQVIQQYRGDLIVDAIFGIGFHGQLSKEMQVVIGAINKNSAAKACIDIPSGLSATTGDVDSLAVIANITVTFIVLKQGLLTGQAANYVGQLFLADLGVGPVFISHIKTSLGNAPPHSTYLQGFKDLPLLVKRQPTSHKGTIGMVLAIGGNLGMPGAIRLSAEAALRCGSALVSVSCHQANQALVFNGRPEIMLAPDNAQKLIESSVFAKAKVCILGPGLGLDNWAKAFFEVLILSEKPCVFDADALVLLSQLSERQCSEIKAGNNHWVLTPHPLEAAKLLHCSVAEIETDRFAAVIAIANQYQCICLLKGAGSLVSDGKTTWLNSSGNAGMASGGMGDVLSGIIGALLLQMPDAFQAVRLACYIHGAAADRIAEKLGQRGMLASDLFVELQQLVNNK